MQTGKHNGTLNQDLAHGHTHGHTHSKAHIHSHRNLIGFSEQGIPIVTREADHGTGDEEADRKAFVKDYMDAIRAYRTSFPTKGQQRELTPDPAVREMIERSDELGFSTTFDRFDAQQPQCSFGLAGICCKVCNMGPCRISAKAPCGVCGADADLIVARNLARAAAAGVAQHGLSLIHI